MHFGKILEEDIIEKWRAHYLQYKLLKKHIKDMESLPSEETGDKSANGLLVNQQITYHEFSFPGPMSHRYSHLSSFKSVLDKEVEKVNNFTLSKVNEIQNRLMHILRTNAAWDICEYPERSATLEFLETQQADCRKISEELISLDKFIRQNCIAIQKIVKKFDKRLQFGVAPWFHAQLMENEAFLKVNLDALLIALSDTYEQLDKIRCQVADSAKDSQNKKEGISAQTFERNTTKYWVRAENLMAIKVAIIQNLPVYLFDRKAADGTRLKNTLQDFNEIYGEIVDSSPITSIYFDNDQLDVYHTRLKREEGAQLHRLRWYGDAQSLPNKDYIFMERKTHHESWVDLKSVKERFPLKTRRVGEYLDGSFDPTETMQKWMKPDRDGVRLIKTDVELEKANQLCAEVQQTIAKQKLKPMIRTIYRRAAFQARTHNDVRISIDTHLMMVNEKVDNSGSEFNWAREMLLSNIPPQDILQFPFCILEVKLNCEKTPQWIANLLADTNAIMERHKFSKFLTGMAYSHYDCIKELPYWFEDEPLLDPRDRFLTMEQRIKKQKNDRQQNGLEENSESEETVGRMKKAHSSNFSAAASHETISQNSTDSAAKSSPKNKNTQHLVLPIYDEPIDDQESTPLLSDRRSSQTSSRAQALLRNINRPMTSGGKLDAFWSGLRRRMFRIGGGGSDEERPRQKPIRSANRVKIEPKTSFANERTLIQWISAASLMITLATLIVTSGTELGFKAGFIFFPLAFLILLYAIARFQYRAWSFRNRANAYHDDLVGPVVLVIAISSAMALILSLMFYYNSDLPDVAPLNDTLNGCTGFSHSGMNDYFPYNDVEYAANGKIYAVGPFTLAAYGNGSWQTVKFPNLHLESIAVGSSEDQLFIGVGRPVPQILLWDTQSATARQSYGFQYFRSAYNLSMQGMTYAPKRTLDKNPCVSGYFLASDHQSSVFIIAIPAAGVSNSSACSTNLELVDMIPGSRIAVGLYDDPFYKHISGMDYDQGSDVLFILFGRVRKLRAIEWSSGKVLRDWYLPGSSFQWSGISLGPVKQDGRRSIYLAQAVPGGIWEFDWSLSGGGVSGVASAEFPACARVVNEDLLERFVSAGSEKFRRTKMRYVGDF